MIIDIYSPSLLEPGNGQKNPLQAYSGSFWHSLYLFNISRIIITSGLVILAWSFQYSTLGSHDVALFFYTALLYLLLSCLFTLLIRLRKPGFYWQLIQQVCADVIFICILSYASGGLEGGLGILLMISLAGGGLISKGRLALFFAAIATIGILLQEIYAFLYIGSYTAQFTHAALLSMGYFAVAWLAHRLASRAIASEKLAYERGIDLANIAQINQLIIQDLQEGILVVDKNGNIRQSNSYAEKLIDLDCPPNYFKPCNLADYVPELASRLVSWRYNANIAFDLLRLPRNNSLIRTRFVSIRNNPHASVIIYLEDTSRIQSQIQQLKLAALGRLTANIAHEIRNPLSSISHAAELLEEDEYYAGKSNASGNSSNRRLLRIIHDNSQRLNRIVQDILQLNRRDTVKSEQIDAAEFIRHFVDDFCLTEKIDSAVFQFKTAGRGSVCQISVDRNHFHQILWNLCRNAWRHCRQQRGSITIELDRNNHTNGIYLNIRDDGPGVPAHQVKQLFEPFFTTASNGTGLGLYIARELCEANNASLEYVEHDDSGFFRMICRDVNRHV
ncbi:two-component system, NtrC family, sensor histidine kinase PilS [Nitrosomonas sp. Nm51]|uniref:two-component system sensor histidine kinase NtrB n=1 Tax=Nitrosomonas sp. Nm51 TaxID=133720 RepID=UPI0008C781F5|nr:ATP-binding protein [Nitrosomonas sp. Nm51]SER61199.1 two-component system, NtrC family, sensor histidine kinase PilS [Nitrosomonas sp. Nm51]